MPSHYAVAMQLRSSLSMQIKEPIEIEEGDEERRDAMLLKALKTPPQPRPKRERKKAEKAAAAPKVKR